MTRVLCLRTEPESAVASPDASCTVTVDLPRFTRGDVDGSGGVNIADVIRLLASLFESLAIDCEDAADINDDATLDAADPIALLWAIFEGSSPPALPYPDCGEEFTMDTLDCVIAPCP